MNGKLLVGIILMLFIACSANDDPVYGKWGDIIKLSEKELSVNAESNSIVITTKGTWWWLNGIELDDNQNYDFSRTDTTQDNFLIEETEFNIERRNANEIHIFLTENESDSDRILTVFLQAGDYFDRITVTQSGK